MTTMEISDLIKLGFNKNEAIVFISLIKFGKADANLLIKDTKFHKNIVYDNLEKLIDKGLVSFIIENNRKVFIINQNALLSLFDEEEKQIIEKKKLASEINKEIEKVVKTSKFKQEATILRGIKAVKSFYNETLKNGNYFVFGAPLESVKIMGETFWKNYTIKRIDNKIKVKMIFNPSIKDFGNKIKNKFTEIRYFDKDFEPLTETHIQEGKIAIIVWTEEPILFLIQDKYVANSYLKFFEKMWKEAII